MAKTCYFITHNNLDDTYIYSNKAIILYIYINLFLGLLSFIAVFLCVNPVLPRLGKYYFTLNVCCYKNFFFI